MSRRCVWPRSVTARANPNSGPQNVSLAVPSPCWTRNAVSPPPESPYSRGGKTVVVDIAFDQKKATRSLASPGAGVVSPLPVVPSMLDWPVNT